MELDVETGLPIGTLFSNEQPCVLPPRVDMDGHFARLEPLDPERHSDELFAAAIAPGAAARHRYLFEPAPVDETRHHAWLVTQAAQTDPLVFAVVDKRTGRAEGRQALMRITPAHRAIELGSILWGPAMARTQVATEALFLIAEQVFERLGYRRLEWKCDALNEPSRRAAARFGFSFEGVFRQHMIVRGRSRDTAWFAMLSEDWPRIGAEYRRWLAPANFDEQGRQLTKLAIHVS